MKKIFLIVGRTASGKTSLAKGACRQLGLNLLKSYITRPPRNDETEESDHIFIHPEEVENYRNRMIAYTDKVDQYVRFATIDQLLSSDLYIIDPNGIEYLKNLDMPELRDIKFIEIYVRTPYLLLKERANRRGDDIDIFRHRYLFESQQFDSYEKEQKFQYHILNNGSLEEGIQKLVHIIQKEL